MRKRFTVEITKDGKTETCEALDFGGCALILETGHMVGRDTLQKLARKKGMKVKIKEIE